MEAKHVISRSMLVAALMVFALAISVTARPAKDDDGGLCGVSKAELLECKPSVATGANPPPPTAACCAALTHANVPCFCGFKNNKYLEPLFGINATRAVELPSKCDPNSSVKCPK